MSSAHERSSRRILFIVNIHMSNRPGRPRKDLATASSRNKKADEQSYYAKCDAECPEGVPAMQCDLCDLWHHAKCEDVSNEAYKAIGVAGVRWFCKRCDKFACAFMSNLQKLSDRQDKLEKKFENMEESVDKKIEQCNERIERSEQKYCTRQLQIVQEKLRRGSSEKTIS